MWIVICVSLLVWVLLLRNGPDRDFGDANEAETLVMVNLAFPASLTILYRPIGEAVAISYSKAGNDLRSIVFPWLYLFVVGYLQWFVLFTSVARWVERK